MDLTVTMPNVELVQAYLSGLTHNVLSYHVHTHTHTHTHTHHTHTHTPHTHTDMNTLYLWFINLNCNKYLVNLETWNVENLLIHHYLLSTGSFRHYGLNTHLTSKWFIGLIANFYPQIIYLWFYTKHLIFYSPFWDFINWTLPFYETLGVKSHAVSFNISHCNIYQFL